MKVILLKECDGLIIFLYLAWLVIAEVHEVDVVVWWIDLGPSTGHLSSAHKRTTICSPPTQPETNGRPFKICGRSDASTALLSPGFCHQWQPLKAQSAAVLCVL